MRDLYPLLLRPEFHERVWGSRNLSPIYSQAVGEKPVGEAWLTGDQCHVANGPLAGRTLGELTVEAGARLLGEAPEPRRFPLLIKFLFPKDRLSVQVHPDNEAAAHVGEPCGKTECWYVLQAEPGAQIALGLKPGIGKQEVESAIRETRLEHLLNWIDVRAGDMYYVDAGTVHAIGPGSIIVETQQNSDTTYRLYDYGRPRELHVERGLRSLKERTHSGKVINGHPELIAGKTQCNLIAAPWFIVDKFRLTRPWRFERPRHAPPAVWCLVGISGCGIVESQDAQPVTFAAGEAVIVPAAVEQLVLDPLWELEFLCASVPAGKTPHPATVPLGNAARSV
jgi:mannose-6-phosphate isomerase